MAGRHRRPHRGSRRFAVIGAVTATATALTVGVAAPPRANAALVRDDVDLTASGVRIFPPPEQIPDLTGGVGSAAYDAAQEVAAALITALVDNVNLAAVAEALGLDPASLVQSLLSEAVGGLLTQVLGGVPVDIAPLLDQLPAGELLDLLQAANLIDLETTLSLQNLLGSLGLDLSQPLDLSNADVPGLNIVTAGPPFTLLKMLGVDLGWVPALPNSVADEVNQTEYLKVGVAGLLETVGDIDVFNDLLAGLGDDQIEDLPDVLHVRVPIVVGWGLGAFAAGAAYSQVVDDLPNQPGGADYIGTDPLIGSYTVMPMLLLRNPGRANGGVLARAYPLARLVGIDLVTPDTEVQHSGDGVPIGDTGLAVGAANLIPVKIDATVEYDPLSDVPAWPNPFSLANSVAAGLFPTYILRGADFAAVAPQLTGQLTEALGDVGPENPLALNLYVTVPSNTLPLLEPLYLVTDVASLVTGQPIPNRLANALAPALTSLVNLGYTDAYRTPDGGYGRSLDDAGTPTAFFSFPEVDWTRVPGDVSNQLVNGFEKEYLSGNPTPATPNAVSGVIDLVQTVVPDTNTADLRQAAPKPSTRVRTPSINATPNPVRAVIGNGRSEVRTAVTNVRSTVRSVIDNTRKHVDDTVNEVRTHVETAVDNVRDQVKDTDADED